MTNHDADRSWCRRAHLLEVSAETTHTLRREVLGWQGPALRIDEGARHLAVVHGDDAVAIVSHLRWPCPDEPGAPARYFWGMAVEQGHRSHGHGRRLLAAVADVARAAGEQLVWADARESAAGFYVACGAQVRGAPYLDELTGLTDRRIVLTV